MLEQRQRGVRVRSLSYLVVFPGLDGLERADPVLHLFPVLGAEDEPAERSDHLEEGVRGKQGGREGDG